MADIHIDSGIVGILNLTSTERHNPKRRENTMTGRLPVLSILIPLSLAAGARMVTAAEPACLSCHSAPGFREMGANGVEKSLYVDQAALASSVHASKSCLDCHVDFRGQSLPHKPTAQPVQCVRCHRSGNTLGTPDVSRIHNFADIVHGSALKNAKPDAPQCEDCHGTHEIRRATDPKSTVYRGSLPATCGKCHPGAGKDFAAESIHVLTTPKRDAVVYWVRMFYILLVVGLMSSFCGYILLDLRARWIGRLAWRRGDHRR